MTKTKAPFEAIFLGKDALKINVAKSIHKAMLPILNDLITELEVLFNEPFTDPLAFISLVGSNDPEKEILGTFQEKRKTDLPKNVNFEKALELGLIRVDTSKALSLISKFNARYSTLGDGTCLISFYEDCFNSETRQFEYSPVLDDAIEEYYTLETQTPEQNELIKNVQELVSSLNNFRKKGYLAGRYVTDEHIKRFLNVIMLKPKGGADPFKVNPLLIHNRYFFPRERKRPVKLKKDETIIITTTKKQKK